MQASGSNASAMSTEMLTSAIGLFDAPTASTWGESVSRGTHRALSSGLAETHAASKTRGTAEALEPILEDRPSSVHSKDNILYMAAQTLRNLPTGSAFLNYVYPRGEKTPPQRVLMSH
jgi:hypothetical protein